MLSLRFQETLAHIHFTRDILCLCVNKDRKKDRWASRLILCIVWGKAVRNSGIAIKCDILRWGQQQEEMNT